MDNSEILSPMTLGMVQKLETLARTVRDWFRDDLAYSDALATDGAHHEEAGRRARASLLAMRAASLVVAPPQSPEVSSAIVVERQRCLNIVDQVLRAGVDAARADQIKMLIAGGR